jgi:beta-aspartyl-peptidase (threonine type)
VVERPEFAIVVHGGAGRWAERLHAAALSGVSAAASAGAQMLARGASALDAVCRAVVVLEDDPIFNAGTGSALNAAGEAEMDAAVMDGAEARFGAVCALQRVRNPVLVARAVMDRTAHCLLGGEGALRFARAIGCGDHDPVTEARRRELAKARAEASRRGARSDPALGMLHASTHDTVGAVALDRDGRLAVATSTGGITMKLAGRIGDSPLPGAGTYATRHAASSATGLGEAILRRLATRTICDRIRAGATPEAAIATVLADLAADDADAGFIALDAQGHAGVAHCSAAMPHALSIAGDAGVTARIAVPR